MESANKGDFYYPINPCTYIDSRSQFLSPRYGLIKFYIDLDLDLDLDEDCRSILGPWSKYLVDGDLNLVLVST